MYPKNGSVHRARTAGLTPDSTATPITRALARSAIAAAVILAAACGMTACSAPAPTASDSAGPSPSPSPSPSAVAPSDAAVEPTAAASRPSDSVVPAPGGGDTTQVLPAVEAGPVTEVAFGTPAVLPSAVTVSIVEVRRDSVSANTPGEIAGPAVIATVRIQNDSASPLDLGSTVVTLLDEAGNPGQATTAGPFDPFVDSLQPGASSDGVYVFGVPAGAASPIRISVSYAGGAPIALFAGDVS